MQRVQLISHWIFSTQRIYPPLSIIKPHLLQTIYTLTLLHVSCTACTYPFFVTKLSVIIARRFRTLTANYLAPGGSGSAYPNPPRSTCFVS